MTDTQEHAELQLVLDDLRRHLAWQAESGETILDERGRSRPPAAAEPAPRSERPARPPARATPPAPPPAASAGDDAPASPALQALGDQPALDEIRRVLGDCRRCKLSGGRKQIVFGVGSPRAELVFVGEGPGAEEDAQGIPFVGA